MLHENESWIEDVNDIREEMNVVAGVVYRVELEVLQGGFDGPDANISRIQINSKDFGECNPPGSNYSCSFYKCPFDLDKDEIMSFTGLLNIQLTFQHSSYHCDCDEDTWECSPKERVNKSGHEQGRSIFTAVARIVLTPIRSIKG